MEKAATLSPLISASELLALTNEEPPNYILLDARAGNGARERYNKSHLQNAIFIDLEKDLADVPEDAAKGGRHPLPHAKVFAEFVGSIGISPSSRVIIYDDKNGANAAARLWWMLRAINVVRAQVLDGGYDAAIAVGFPTNDKPPNIYPVEFNIEDWQLPVATLQQVEQAAKTANCFVIDVREQHRYNGEFEPIDLIAGHIPGAINIPFPSNLETDGKFLQPEQLRELYRLYANNAGETIVHCGSGVTACHTLLAFETAGFKMPSLYVGSWSEWSRNGKPIATNLP